MSKYRDTLQKLLRDACPDAETYRALTFKNVFGAVAGYIDEQIFCSCGRFGFALKLPENDRNLLFKDGAQPLRYFPNGHVKKDYAVLTSGMLGDPDRLCDLIKASIEYTAKA